MQEGKLKSKVYQNFREKKDGAPKGVGAFSIEGVDGGPLLGPVEEALFSSGIGRRARLYGGLTSRLPMSVLSHCQGTLC